MKVDETFIQTFVDNNDYDLRKTHNGRFTDQKCIPDVVNAVADCIIEYVCEDRQKSFSKNDIWHSDYARRLLGESFSKPDTENMTVQAEYDKFFAQPMKLLAAADVLAEKKIGNTNEYYVKQYDILAYIAMREKNALIFLDVYLTKVMRDSGCLPFFDAFFQKQDTTTFNALRETLRNLIITNTPITGDYEPPRIYNKIINILAFRRRKKGSVKGAISRNPLTIDEIRYNRVNWRDIGKAKGVSRQEYAMEVENQIHDYAGFYERAVSQAKSFVRDLEPYSEIHPYPAYKATEAHHIFMKSEFPELADMPENIIALTGTEHYSYAHPERNTHKTDADYQMVCLISKLDSIERNFQNGGKDYSLEEFVTVLNTGLNTDYFNEAMGFELIKARLLQYLRPSTNLSYA